MQNRWISICFVMILIHMTSRIVFVSLRDVENIPRVK